MLHGAQTPDRRRVGCACACTPARVQVPAGPGEYYEASAEDLAAFEYSADEQGPEWRKSTESWLALLDSLGGPTNPAVVRKVSGGGRIIVSRML